MYQLPEYGSSIFGDQAANIADKPGDLEELIDVMAVSSVCESAENSIFGYSPLEGLNNPDASKIDASAITYDIGSYNSMKVNLSPNRDLFLHNWESSTATSRHVPNNRMTESSLFEGNLLELEKLINSPCKSAVWCHCKAEFGVEGKVMLSAAYIDTLISDHHIDGAEQMIIELITSFKKHSFPRCVCCLYAKHVALMEEVGSKETFGANCRAYYSSDPKQRMTIINFKPHGHNWPRKTIHVTGMVPKNCESAMPYVELGPHELNVPYGEIQFVASEPLSAMWKIEPLVTGLPNKQLQTLKRLVPNLSEKKIVRRV